MEKEAKQAPTSQGTQGSTAATPGQQKKDYIGCLMSLISKQEIRYAGTLVAINSKDQTLVLQNVKSYGSEGRRGGGPDEVPASTQVYEKVSFRAAELKDFYVIKGPEKDFKDPAIISTEKTEEKTEEKKIEGKSHEGESKTEPRPRDHYQPREYNGPKRGQHYRQRGRGRTEGKFQEHTRKDVQEKYADEFDFESMNKKLEEGTTDKEKNPEVEAKYDKGKSFFDSISRSKDEKNEVPFNKTKQREIDAETFDFDPNENRGGRYSRYRRGWRRGYRRGRGQQNYGRRGQQPYYRRRADS